jgi:hypothetical protein
MSNTKYTIQLQQSHAGDPEAWPLSTLKNLGPVSANLFVIPDTSGGSKVVPAHVGAPGAQPLSTFGNATATVSAADIENAAKNLGPVPANSFFTVRLIPENSGGSK